RKYANWNDWLSSPERPCSVGRRIPVTRRTASYVYVVTFPFGSTTRVGTPNSGRESVATVWPSALVLSVWVGIAHASGRVYAVVGAPPVGSVTLVGRPRPSYSVVVVAKFALSILTRWRVGFPRSGGAPSWPWVPGASS